MVEDREQDTASAASESVDEVNFVPATVDPVEAKQRLLRLIDDALDDTPKGRAAKDIVNELPIED